MILTHGIAVFAARYTCAFRWRGCTLNELNAGDLV